MYTCCSGKCPTQIYHQRDVATRLAAYTKLCTVCAPRERHSHSGGQVASLLWGHCPANQSTWDQAGTWGRGREANCCAWGGAEPPPSPWPLCREVGVSGAGVPYLQCQERGGGGGIWLKIILTTHVWDGAGGVWWKKIRAKSCVPAPTPVLTHKTKGPARKPIPPPPLLRRASAPPSTEQFSGRSGGGGAVGGPQGHGLHNITAKGKGR